MITELTRNLNDEKLPFDGGLHDMTAAFPLRAITDKFAGGSGAVRNNENHGNHLALIRLKC